jgi:hypothetical protein
MYHGEGGKGGYISYKKLKTAIKKYSSKFVSQKEYRKSMFTEPSIDEIISKISNNNIASYELEECFMWHEGLIAIEGSYYWTDPFTYFVFDFWIKKNHKKFLVREDGITHENFIEKVIEARCAKEQSSEEVEKTV